MFIYMTFAHKAEAQGIVNTLVAERLLACANIFPAVSSVYWWQGKMEHATEAAAVGKTTQNRYKALEKRFCELHPYETPCLVALPVSDGFGPYLRWVDQETTIPAP